MIMLSARAGEEARLEGLAASADDYLVKPFSARDCSAASTRRWCARSVHALEQRHAQRLASLFAHAPVAIARAHGPEHVFELANQRYRELDRRPRRRRHSRFARRCPSSADQGIYEMLDARARSRASRSSAQSLRAVLESRPGRRAEECAFDFVYQPVRGCATAASTPSSSSRTT